MDWNDDFEKIPKIRTKTVENLIFITEIINKFDLNARLRTIARLKDISQAEFAKRLGMSQSTLFTRSKNGKFNFEERRRIADALNCKFVIKYVFEDGAEFTGKTARQLISDSCAHAGITLAELSERLGLQSRQALNMRLDRDKLTDEELEDIANKIGCTCINHFELEDDVAI